MFPLKDWNNMRNGYVFRQKYPRGWGSLTGKNHLGLDKICPAGTLLISPFNGSVVRTYWGSDGGNTIEFRPDNQDIVLRFMHLKDMVKPGRYNAGADIGHTGNTGKSTAPHLHVDISVNHVDINNIDNFLDPINFKWEEIMNDHDIAYNVLKPIWQDNHGGAEPDMNSLVNEARLIREGKLPVLDLYRKWRRGE